MNLRRALLVFAVFGLVAVLAGPGECAQKGKEDTKDDKKTDPNMWSPPEQVDGGRGMKLSEEEISRIMERIKKSNPQKAKELNELRTLDEQKFRRELREFGREEFSKIVRERIEEYRRNRREAFVKWLDKEYQREAKELAKLKPKDANVYNKRFDLVWKKYGYVYEAWRRSEELGKVLKQDLALKKRRDDLLERLKREKDDKKKKELGSQLKRVIEDRFDLITRRKQIEYDRLLKRLKDLQDQINKQKSEIREWRNQKFKKDNVEQRIKELTEGIPKFKWN